MNELRICVVGMGYVGLPLAVELVKHFPVVGFDINQKKIALLKSGKDPTNEVGDAAIKSTQVKFTDNPSDIKSCNFVIVAVPTPVNEDYSIDLKPVESASRVVGENLSKGAIIVYESTVYPGCTEEVCVPILEQASGFHYPQEFKIGYSPERINPGDKVHRVDTIVKIISGCDPETTETIHKVYSSIIKAGLHVARDIRTAEAAKVIENIQRDLNIALMNELSIIFNKLGISTREVIEAAGTKWNFHKYHPGLVGGHCIGVDPYYLVYKSREIGYEPKVILAGRAINEHMPIVVAEATAECLKKAKKSIRGSKILILGLTFKENVNDYRNSKISMTLAQLKKDGAELFGFDPLLDKTILEKNFGVINGELKANFYDAIIYVNNHDAFANITLEKIKSWSKGIPVLIDVRMRYDSAAAKKLGFLYWSA
jgi:UDP-N-acetyl-D-glucosamine/UDP-N-acetyl-D-galactosamine dehydrogenase